MCLGRLPAVARPPWCALASILDDPLAPDPALVALLDDMQYRLKCWQEENPDAMDWLLEVDDLRVVALLRLVNHHDVALALRGAQGAIWEKVGTNMSDEDWQRLQTTVAAMGPVEPCSAL